jgi:hypothetical protein
VELVETSLSFELAFAVLSNDGELDDTAHLHWVRHPEVHLLSRELVITDHHVGATLTAHLADFFQELVFGLGDSSVGRDLL